MWDAIDSYLSKCCTISDIAQCFLKEQNMQATFKRASQLNTVLNDAELFILQKSKDKLLYFTLRFSGIPNFILCIDVFLGDSYYVLESIIRY